MIGAIIDTGDLVQVIWVSLLTGIGVTGAFGLAILGSTRAMDLGRHGRPAEATLFGVVGAVATVAVIVAIVLGIVAMSDK